MLNTPFRIVEKSMAALDFRKDDPETEIKNQEDFMYADPDQAMDVAEGLAASGFVCEGIHGHKDEDGNTIYMPCGSHEEFQEVYDAMSEQDGYGPKDEDKKYESINFKPSEAVAKEAQRGLDWREEHNRGGTAIGVARARDLSNRKTLSPKTIKRMVSYFARHEVDKKGEGWSPGEDGYPSAGRIAWALWGGDAGRSWANARKRSMDAEDKKSAPLNMVKELDEETIGDGVLIEGPVSSGVMDRDGDIVDPQAVMRAWEGYKKNPIILHNHQRGGIGKMVDVRMGEWPGLDHEVPIGRALIDGNEKDICHKVRKGIIRAFSIGFIAREGGIERMADEDGRVTHRFVDIDWVETSVVDIPSNPMALFDVVKEAVRVQAKSSAPDSFINPFSMWIVRTGETMTAEEVQEVVEEEEVLETTTEEVPASETKDAPIMETNESPEEELADDVSPEEESVSPEQFKQLSEKVDHLIDAVLALNEKSQESETEEITEDPEITALKSEVEELRQAKAAAELEAKINAEVEARVKSIMGDQTEVPQSRSPERKSISGSPQITNETFKALADERNVSVGTVKGEAWLSAILGSRRKQ